ncbi:MAG: prolyl oligopeptidase family serine peptidase, partial [Trebonia sp.]
MVDLIPRSVLFGNPERTSPRMSHDGSQLGWIAPRDGVLNVWVAPIGESDGVDWAAARAVTDDTDRGIRMFGWAWDGRHLLYVQDAGGDENWRLYDVDLVTGERRDLTPFEKIHAQIIGSSKRRPTEVLVGMNADNPQLHDVYRLDLVTGNLVKEIENPGYAGWLADEDLVVRCALAPLPDGSLDVLVRDSASADWRTLLTIPAEDVTSSDVVSFSGDGRSLVMISAAGADTGRLTRVDLATGATTVLAEDPEADVTGAVLDPDTRDPQIVMILKDRMTYVVLDPSVQDDLKAIRGLHPGDPMFLGRDEADQTWLVGFNVDAGSLTFYMYDRASKSGRLLFEARPALSSYTLAAMEPFSFTARDGLEIHGYVTFPPGEGRSSLPAVLDVHGGPQVRDSWGYNPEAQWFANRGYLCVQVNYRGSTGYGKAFVAAGDREWGGKMHDDLIDAVSYITGQGWADPSRVAIYGGSYGGYAALVGAAFTPGVFRCAVDIVGPSNLKTLLETVPPYWAPMIAQLYRRVGNPETDAEFLWSRSPLSRARDIRIPLLIAQGANDPRVKQAESE